MFFGQGDLIGALLSVYGEGRAGRRVNSRPNLWAMRVVHASGRTAGRSALSLNASVPFLILARRTTRHARQ